MNKKNNKFPMFAKINVQISIHDFRATNTYKKKRILSSTLLSCSSLSLSNGYHTTFSSVHVCATSFEIDFQVS